MTQNQSKKLTKFQFQNKNSKIKVKIFRQKMPFAKTAKGVFSKKWASGNRNEHGIAVRMF